jgi:biopolymer transport protein ExbD
MSAWSYRLKAAPQNIQQIPAEYLLPLLQQGTLGPNHEFLPPGSAAWLSAAEALYQLQVPTATKPPARGATPVPMGRPVGPAARPAAPAPAARPVAGGPRPAPPPGAPTAQRLGPERSPTASLASGSEAARGGVPTARPAPSATARRTRQAKRQDRDARAVPAARGAADVYDAARPRRTAAREADDDELEMTPMIDMTFLLLIFFMVAGTISKFANMPLPQSLTGDTENPVGRVVVVLEFPELLSEAELANFNGAAPIMLADARITIEGSDGVVAPSELESRLADRFQSQPGQLILQAHRKMPTSVVREVLMIAKRAGAQQTLVGVSVPR